MGTLTASTNAKNPLELVDEAKRLLADGGHFSAKSTRMKVMFNCTAKAADMTAVTMPVVAD